MRLPAEDTDEGSGSRRRLEVRKSVDDRGSHAPPEQKNGALGSFRRSFIEGLAPRRAAKESSYATNGVTLGRATEGGVGAKLLSMYQ